MRSCSIVPALLFCGFSLRADPVVIHFDALNDGDPVTTQFAGLTFSNAVVLTAGSSLNEFEFPPHSGANVVFDFGAPISISFADPVMDFGGFFTYASPLTLQAFDASNNLVASAVSGFSSNLALSGDPGSSANEFLTTSFAPGISSITITGDPAGGSFVLDDATITPRSGLAPVPEPSPLPLLAVSLAIVVFLRGRRVGRTSK